MRQQINQHGWQIKYIQYIPPLNLSPRRQTDGRTGEGRKVGEREGEDSTDRENLCAYVSVKEKDRLTDRRKRLERQEIR